MAIWHVMGRPINFDSIDSARHEDPRWDHWCIWHDFIVILICYRSVRLVRILVIHLDIFAIATSPPVCYCPIVMVVGLVVSSNPYFSSLLSNAT